MKGLLRKICRYPKLHFQAQARIVCVTVAFTGELFLTQNEFIYTKDCWRWWLSNLRQESKEMTDLPASFLCWVLTLDAGSKRVPTNRCPVVPREESYSKVWKEPWREGMKGRLWGSETPRRGWQEFRQPGNPLFVPAEFRPTSRRTMITELLASFAYTV